MNFSFDTIDFNSLISKNDSKINDDNENSSNNIIEYDNTTNETYRIKRLFKIDPILDNEVPENLAFKFIFSWDPYTGIRNGIDVIGPLYFNAITLYDYYFSNRFIGLWIPPSDQFQGYYGDLIGTSKNIEIKSRGSYPEKYLYRLPIIDCYLPTTHNLSIVTIGPELNDNEIKMIDDIIFKYHPKKNLNKFTALSELKKFYDKALEKSPDPNCIEIIELKKKFLGLSNNEINEKYNRFWVDKLVNLKY